MGIDTESDSRSRKNYRIARRKTGSQKRETPRKKPEIIWEETDCPKCKSHKLIKGKTAIGCTDFKQCGFKIPFEIFGKKLTEKQIQDLILKGKTSKLKGFKSHPDGLDEGVLSLSEGFGVNLI